MRNCRAISVLVAACLIYGCGGDKPTEPEPVKDYPVYFWGGAGVPNYLFRYHPTNRTIDTCELAYEPKLDVNVSADGKLLYLVETDRIVVVDTGSLFQIPVLPFVPASKFASLVISPDNMNIAVHTGDLSILRALDYSVIFSDTDKTQNGRFSADGKRFYCAAGWSPTGVGYLYKVDLSDTTPAVTRKSFSQGGVRLVVPTPDESKLLLYLLVQTFVSAFAVYDVALDSVVFIEYLVPGQGNIEISVDGRYAFYTNPGTILIGPPPPSTFTIFDIQNNSIDRVVSLKGFVDDNHPLFAPFSMAVTPDGRWLVLQDSNPPLRIALYDLKKGMLVDYQDLSQFLLGNLTTQIWP